MRNGTENLNQYLQVSVCDMKAEDQGANKKKLKGGAETVEGHSKYTYIPLGFCGCGSLRRQSSGSLHRCYFRFAISFLGTGLKLGLVIALQHVGEILQD